MGQIEPGSRVEMLLLGILNGETTTNIEPATRVEALLKAILENGGGGGGGGGGLPSVTEADIGKILRVLAGGVWGADPGDDLARIDGYYEGLTAGQVEQVISKVNIIEKTPYLFRTAGGSADIGNRKKIRGIIGASVGHNQLIENGDFSGNTGWSTSGASLSISDGIGTMTASAQNGYIYKTFNTIEGHLYLVQARVKLTTATTSVAIKTLRGSSPYDLKEISTASTTEWQTLSALRTATYGDTYNVRLVDARADERDAIQIDGIKVTDLTVMLGEAIATAAAGKETTLAGSGLAWLRSMGFINDSYAYDAGTLLPVKTTGNKTIGFNALNPTTHKARCIGGQQYEIVGGYTGVTYEDDSGDPETLTVSSDKFTPARDGVLTVAGSDGLTCVHLVHSGYRDGETEEYSEHLYPIDDIELNGRLMLDESGNVYADGDVYLPSGNVTKKWGTYTFTGQESWSQNSDTNRWFATFEDDALYASDVYIVCDRFLGIVSGAATGSSGAEMTTGQIRLQKTSTYKRVILCLDGATTEADIQAATAGATIAYPLASNVTETADPYTETMVCDDFGTEEFVDERAIPVPVPTETAYPANNADKLDHLPSPAEADGYYIIYQSGKTMRLVAMASPLPAFPSEDGAYNLKFTKSGSTETLTWEAE